MEILRLKKKIMNLLTGIIMKIKGKTNKRKKS